MVIIKIFLELHQVFREQIILRLVEEHRLSHVMVEAPEDTEVVYQILQVVIIMVLVELVIVNQMVSFLR